MTAARNTAPSKRVLQAHLHRLQSLIAYFTVFTCRSAYLAALPALDRADAFGLAMGALAATTVRFVLAGPEALGFKNIQPVAVAAFPAALAVAALA